MRDNVSNKPTAKSQLGTLFQFKNLMKSLGSLVPGTSVPIEMMNQLDGERVDARISQAEAQLTQLAATQSALASQKSGVLSKPNDWSIAAGEFMSRTAIIATVFDGGFHGARFRGQERFHGVGHACVVGPNEVLTCREVMDLASSVAEHKHGRSVVLVGMAWYEFEAGPIDAGTGLRVLRLTNRDEAKWSNFQSVLAKIKAPMLGDPVPTMPQVRYSVMPWIGSEIGFIHCGEAENAWSASTFEHLQFDATTISHFMRTPKESLKTFVTGVLPGRIVYAGAPVFTRDATLLGVISDTESYPSDNGRRAVVRSLLGHPNYKPNHPTTPSK
jgi:hypothetical protein